MYCMKLLKSPSLRKICQNTGFLCLAFSHVSAGSRFCPRFCPYPGKYGLEKTRIQPAFYAVLFQ